VRDHTPAPCHANLPGRIIRRRDAALSASAATPADDVSGRDQRSRGCDLPGSPASTAPAATAASGPRRRTWLSFRAGAYLRRPKFLQHRDADSLALFRYTPAAMPRPGPSSRKLAAIAAIMLLIVFWAAFVASLAPLASQWAILVQAPYYLIMGSIWIIPLKPLIRWSESGRFRAPRE
jgi:hypothetical protein